MVLERRKRLPHGITPDSVEYAVRTVAPMFVEADRLREQRKATPGWRPRVIWERSKLHGREQDLRWRAELEEYNRAYDFSMAAKMLEGRTTKNFVYEAGMQAIRIGHEDVNFALAGIMQQTPEQLLERYRSPLWQDVPVLARAVTEIALASATDTRVRKSIMLDTLPANEMVTRLMQMLFPEKEVETTAPRRNVAQDLFTILGLYQKAADVIPGPFISERGETRIVGARVPKLGVDVAVTMLGPIINDKETKNGAVIAYIAN